MIFQIIIIIYFPQLVVAILIQVVLRMMILVGTIYVLLLSKCLGRTAVAFPTNFCGMDSTETHGLICPSFCCRAQSVDKYYYAHIFPVHCCLRAYRGFPFWLTGYMHSEMDALWDGPNKNNQSENNNIIPEKIKIPIFICSLFNFNWIGLSQWTEDNGLRYLWNIYWLVCVSGGEMTCPPDLIINPQ